MAAIGKQTGITISIGALLAIVFFTYKATMWISMMTETVKGTSELVAEMQKSVRYKGEQDWTRGQTNRYMVDVEKAIGQDLPKVWSEDYDAKE